MRDLRKATEDLTRLLAEEIEIYGEMLPALEAEREALLRMDAAEVAEIASKKQTLALRIKALDESRRVMSARLSRDLGIPRDELTVTRLCERAPREAAGRLAAARDRLRELAEACREVNRENARAARKGLDLIQSATDYLVTESDPAGRVYQKKGAYGASPARRAAPAIVSRAV